MAAPPTLSPPPKLHVVAGSGRLRTAAPPPVSVVIGQFGPLTQHDLCMLRNVLSQTDRLVIVLDAAFQALSLRVPFAWDHREAAIRTCFTAEELTHIRFLPLREYHRPARWVEGLRETLHQLPDIQAGAPVQVLARLSSNSREVSRLRNIPSWTYEPLPEDEDSKEKLREALFAEPADHRSPVASYLQERLPKGMLLEVEIWRRSGAHERLAREWGWLQAYRLKWPRQAHTADAVVVCNDSVLLIERGEGAGAGLFALPGGFLEEGETFYDAALRELEEETGLDAGALNLAASFVEAETFGLPDRSLRARIVTVAHLFEMRLPELPPVRGNDDARQAIWIPVADLPWLEGRLFEDHFQILDHFLGVSTTHPTPPFPRAPDGHAPGAKRDGRPWRRPVA